MTEEQLRSALKSLNEIFPLLDQLGELNYFVDALDIMSCNLLDSDLGDYWNDCNKEQAYKKFCRVHTQLSMIKELSRRSKKFLDDYEENLRDKLCPAQDVLTEINRELSEDKLLAIPTNSTLETCNNFMIDNSIREDYYYW